MKELLRHILIVAVLTYSVNSKAQVVSQLLYSKMDAFPQHNLWDGNSTMLMGFTELIGTPIGLPSPVLIFNEGDSVDLSLYNFSQPAPHTIHLHGLDVDQQNDGVPHLSFSVPHDSTGHYIFVAPHAGTYLYHCHVLSTLHVQAGMYGLIIIRPPDGSMKTWDGGYTFDNENAWLFSEIDTHWHTFSVINDPWDPQDSIALLLDYDPQYFLINGKSETELTAPESSINAPVGATVYVRLANIGYYGNRVIFPSALDAQIIDSDGRPLPTVIDSDTVEILPGERYGVLLYPTAEMTDVVQVEYFDLNTQVVANTQNAPVTIEGYLNQDFNYSKQFEVYPNPTNGDLSIKFNNLETLQSLTVTDLQGKIIFQKQYNKTVNNTEELSLVNVDNGLYMIIVQTENGIYSEKVIIKN